MNSKLIKSALGYTTLQLEQILREHHLKSANATFAETLAKVSEDPEHELTKIAQAYLRVWCGRDVNDKGVECREPGVISAATFALLTPHLVDYISLPTMESRTPEERARLEEVYQALKVQFGE